jgi:hypothetical protein
MNRLLMWLLGVMLILAAGIGLIFGGSGLVLYWRFAPRLESNLQNGVNLLERSVKTTGDLLQLVGQVLDQSMQSVDTVDTTLQDVGSMLGSTSQVTASVSNLFQKDLVPVVQETQSSLESVQSSAKVIDDTLKIISGIPFIGARYRPDVPLQDSIARVKGSLDSVPVSLKSVGKEMDTASTNILAMQSDLDTLGQQIIEIRQNLSKAEKTIADYQIILEELRASLELIRGGLPETIRLLGWGVSLFLVWLLIAQVGLLTQGLELIQRSKGTPKS